MRARDLIDFQHVSAGFGILDAVLRNSLSRPETWTAAVAMPAARRQETEPASRKHCSGESRALGQFIDSCDACCAHGGLDSLDEEVETQQEVAPDKHRSLSICPQKSQERGIGPPRCSPHYTCL